MNPSSRSKPKSSSSESDHSADDIWDDTLIIRNYDESLAMVKEEVAKRLAMKTNKKMLASVEAAGSKATDGAGAAAKKSLGPEMDDAVAGGSGTEIKQEDGDSSGVEGSGSPVIEKGASETGAKPVYNVGDYCRATYDDGVDYEAKILALNKTGDTLIRYIGYNNEQTVSVEDLVPSWGRKARRKQREDAVELAAEEDSAANRMDISDEEHEKLTKKASKIRINIDPSFRMPKGPAPTLSGAANAGFSAAMRGAAFMVPPPPPMPPMLEDENDLEQENLSAMLMSWYMSGYYTGLYHGQKMNQKRPRPS